jgi:hypothetical protein
MIEYTIPPFPLKGAFPMKKIARLAALLVLALAILTGALNHAPGSNPGGWD